MKKLLTILLCILLVGCSTTKIERINIEGFQEISYTKLNQLMKEDKQFLLYIGRDDCGDCQQFKPLLVDYIENHEGTGIYYLNIKTFRDNAKKDNATNEEKEFYENLSKTFKFNWTPTLEMVTKGKIGKQYQYLDEDYYTIKDREQQIKRRKEFEQEFVEYMDDYFKE